MKVYSEWIPSIIQLFQLWRQELLSCTYATLPFSQVKANSDPLRTGDDPDNQNRTLTQTQTETPTHTDTQTWTDRHTDTDTDRDTHRNTRTETETGPKPLSLSWGLLKMCGLVGGWVGGGGVGGWLTP